MITDNAIRAEILTQAVPYIKEYTGKYVVAKYGGNAMTDPVLKKNVMQDILLLHLIGVNVILVHGGGPDINAMLDALKIESHFENGLRVTDKDTMDVVQMVLAGKVNKGLVAYLSALGGKAIGLCGIDGNMIQVHTKNEKLGLVERDRSYRHGRDRQRTLRRIHPRHLLRRYRQPWTAAQHQCRHGRYQDRRGTECRMSRLHEQHRRRHERPEG